MAWPVLVFDIESIPDAEGLRRTTEVPAGLDDAQVVEHWRARRAEAGQGDFMPDKFERHTGYNIIRVPFTLQSKDTIYKNLLQVIQNTMTSIPDVRSDRDFIGWLTECVNLEKEWKGRFLSVHHPDSSTAHDDYPDSWALAEHAKTELVNTEPLLRVL